MSLDGYTTDQLKAMHAEACQRAEVYYDAARELTRKMNDVPADRPDVYDGLAHMWSIVFAAGAEQHELAAAIGRETLIRAAE